MLASELIAQVRRLGSLSTATNTADSDVLAHADMEILSRMLPEVRRVQQEYFVRQTQVTSVNGRVDLPRRAQGAGVRLVQLVLPGGYYPRLPRLMPEDVVSSSSAPTPLGFVFDGGGIILVPPGSTNATVLLWYYCSPSKLVIETNTARACIISAVAADTPTAGRTRFTFTSGTIASPVDIVSAGPGHELLAISATAANVTATTLDVATSSLLGAVQVGDWMCAQGYTPLVQLPEECASALVHRTASRMLMALGYLQEAEMQATFAEAAMVSALEYLRPRSDGNPKRIKGGTLTSWAKGGFPVWFRW